MSKSKETKKDLVVENAAFACQLTDLGAEHPVLLTEKSNKGPLKAQRQELQRLLEQATAPPSDDTPPFDDQPITEDPSSEEGPHDTSSGEPPPPAKDDQPEESSPPAEDDPLVEALEAVNNELPDTPIKRMNGPDVEQEGDDDQPDVTLETIPNDFQPKQRKLRNREIVWVPRLRYSLADNDEASRKCLGDGVDLSLLPRGQDAARESFHRSPDKLKATLGALEQLSVTHLGTPYLHEAYELAKDLIAAKKGGVLEALLDNFDTEDTRNDARDIAACQLHRAAELVMDKIPRATLQSMRTAQRKSQANRQDDTIERLAAQRTPPLSSTASVGGPTKSSARAQQPDSPISPKRENQPVRATRKDLLARQCNSGLALLHTDHPLQQRDSSDMDEKTLEDFLKEVIEAIAKSCDSYMSRKEADEMLKKNAATLQQQLNEAQKDNKHLLERVTQLQGDNQTIATERDDAETQRDQAQNLADSRISPNWKLGFLGMVVIAGIFLALWLINSLGSHLQPPATSPSTPQSASSQVEQEQEEEATTRRLNSILKRVEGKQPEREK